MRPSDKHHWIQFLVLLILATPLTVYATPTENRWENADLIVEGRITPDQTTLTIERILKTKTIITQDYTKGQVASIAIQVPESTMKTEKPYIVFLEETDQGYEIIYAEENPQTTPPTLNPATTGLAALTLLALSIIKIKE